MLTLKPAQNRDYVSIVEPMYRTPAKIRWLLLAIIFQLWICGAVNAATTWYVDNKATGSNNGTSWVNAWTSISPASGASVNAGDTVYISTGTYANFIPKNGTSGNPITYKIGQETGHNGTVTFTGSGTWLNSPSDVIVSGDTGDDGLHFVFSGYSKVVNGSNSNRFRLSYINFGTMAGNGTGTRALDFSGLGVEIDHCSLTHDNSAVSSDALILFDSTASTAYDAGIKLHHNTFLTWTKSDGGPDVFKASGHGITVYNNTFGTYAKTLSGTPEHQDGIQDWTGNHQYYKLYNNIFYDLKNAGMVISAYNGGYQHMRMYNNLIVFTSSTASGSCQGGGIAINSGYIGATPVQMTDCVVANNLIAGGAQSWNLYNAGFGGSTNFAGSVHSNNISVDGAGFQIDGGVTASNNITMTTSAAVINFQTFISTLSGLANDFHLRVGAGTLIGKGTNLTAYGITTDFDGKSRPASGVWDIGPFQYSTGGTPTPTPSATPTPTPTATPTPPPGGLTFAAKDCAITPPFAVDVNGDVSQSVETGIPGSGRASYFFTVTDAGGYNVSIVVSAPNSATDSFFVSIDLEPTDPLTIWDIIPLTSGFESRTVGWRGNGTFSDPEYPVKSFDLSVGTHQFIIRGREANVKMRTIMIVPAGPEAPSGLKIVH